MPNALAGAMMDSWAQMLNKNKIIKRLNNEV
jgi:hypothetical protein